MRRDGWVGVGTLVLMLAAAGVPAAAAPVDPLAGDARLAQKVKVTAEGVPVEDLLARIVQKSGVSLAASRETADDKVILFAPARPLHEVLGDLAALFNDRWQRRKPADGSARYVLVRDVAAQRVEARLAQAVTTRMMAGAAEWVRALVETPEQLARRPEHDPIRALLSDEEGRVGTLFYAALSLEQRAALFDRRRLDVPFAALSPAEQTPLRAAFAQRIAMEQEFARQVHEQDPNRTVRVHQADDLEKGTLRFRLQRTGGFTSVGMGLGVSPLAAHADAGDRLATSGWPVALLDSRAEWLLPPHGDPYSGRGVPADAPLPAPAAIRAAAAGKSWPDRLRKLAEGTDEAVMADFYRGKPVARPPDEPDSSSSAETPASALDALCRPAGYLWWTHGRTLLLRRRDWYEQQAYEVPDRWMLALIARLAHEQNRPSAADVLRVLDLTADQLSGLDSLPADPYVSDPDALTGVRELLAIFQASRGEKNGPLPTENAATAAGERLALRFSDLDLGQRRLLPALAEARGYPVTPAEAAGFSAQLSAGQVQPGDAGYRCVPIRVEWGWGSEGSRRVMTLFLPAALPDDRRDRTRIEVVP